MPAKSFGIKANRTIWFRFYAEALDDPKVQRLPPHLFKMWVNLMAFACKRGGSFRRDDVAFSLRMSDHDATSQMDELISLGLLDITSTGALTPHNWETRQFVSDTSTERVRKHREIKKKQPCNGGETFHVAAPETETDTETDKNAASAASAKPAAALPELSDLKKLSDRLFEAAEPCLSNRAIAPGLFSMMIPQMWLDQGCDLERDVVPTIQAIAAKGKRNIGSWDYFTRPIAETKARRSAGMPSVDLQSPSPFARKKLDLSKLIGTGPEYVA